MEKNIEKRITLQPYVPLSHLHLTSFPIGNLRNPGIGIRLFDVMLPLHGTERFETKKQDGVLPGSFEESIESSSVVKQEGFGATKSETNLETLNSEKINNLDSDIYNAMQHATIKTSSFVYKPPQKKSKITKNKIKKKHKFNLV